MTGSLFTFVSGSVGNTNRKNVILSENSYTTAGTYSWVAPAGVTSVSVVCVGPGGAGSVGGSNNGYATGGGGGGLGYKNNISVTPGQSYTVVVGTVTYGSGNPAATGEAYALYNGNALAGNATASYFINTSTVMGGPGGRGEIFASGVGGAYVGDGGGNGGNGGTWANLTSSSFSGGGAGGYSGNGGNGGATLGSYGGSGQSGSNGTGGGGGGGGGGGYYTAGSGGGVGLNGQGSKGSGGASNSNYGGPGGGGSGGSSASTGFGTSGIFAGPGGVYGGGGAGVNARAASTSGRSWNPGGGAVRIIWANSGVTRAFPNTLT